MRCPHGEPEELCEALEPVPGRLGAEPAREHQGAIETLGGRDEPRAGVLPLQHVAVEGGVVREEYPPATELGKFREGLGRGRTVLHVAVGDSVKQSGRGGNRALWVYPRGPSVEHGPPAKTHRPDADEPVVEAEPSGLGVERDEFYEVEGGHSVGTAVRRRNPGSKYDLRASPDGVGRDVFCPSTRGVQ